MRKTFMTLLLFIVPSLAHASQIDHQKCDRLVADEAKELCHRIERSKELLEKIDVKFIFDKRGQAIEREVAAVICPKGEDAVVVRLRTPFAPKADQQINFVSATPERYEFTHVRGQYMHKLTVRAHEKNQDGVNREVPVCAMKHLFIPPQHRGNQAASHLKKYASARIYMPVTAHTYHEEFFVRGLEQERKFMAEIWSDLAIHKVPSKAFPERMLVDVYSPEQLIRIFAIEQTDPFRRYGLPIFGRQQEAEPELMRQVFAEVFIWGDDAFRYLCSSARACGRFQFTNNKSTRINEKKKPVVYPGTYSAVVERCKDQSGKPLLDPDFWKGTEDHRNSAIAAVCLLDIELAALPKGVRDWYLDDPQIGMMFPVIAYNTGGGWARSIYERLLLVLDQANGWKLSLQSFEQMPGKIFLGKKANKPFMNQEPCYYVHKWLESWKHNFAGDPGHAPDCR